MLLPPGAKIFLAPGQTVGIPALLAADKTAFGYAWRYRGLHGQHFPFIENHTLILLRCHAGFVFLLYIHCNRHLGIEYPCFWHIASRVNRIKLHRTGTGLVVVVKVYRDLAPLRADRIV
ncbi:hypothetical protein D3C81_1467910 [compost metagenome]